MARAFSLSGRRIIFVLGSLELGGAERQALQLAGYLKREKQAAVEVWGLAEPGRAAELCDEMGIPWKIVPVRWARGRFIRWPLAIIRFAWALRRAGAEIVLPYCALPNVICGLSWRWSGAALCIWNQRDEGRELCHDRWERMAIRQTPLFVSNSTAAEEFLAGQCGVPSNLVRLIHNGVQLASPVAGRNEWRGRLGVADGRLVAVMVANIHRYKDHVTLIRAWKQVVEALEPLGKSALLLLAGRVQDDAATALTAELNLQNHVRFLGAVADISGLLTAVDLGVFSSKFEGCPNAVLECMASGLAVVATDIPGTREALGPDCDELVPPDDPTAMAATIRALLTDPERRRTIGERNRARISEEFMLNRMCDKTSELIEAAISHKHKIR